MEITKTEFGLEMTADVIERKEIRKLIKRSSNELVAEASFIVDYLPGYEQVRPEDIGALTAAPLISDGNDVYGFMDYQIRSLLDELAKGETVRWQRG